MKKSVGSTQYGIGRTFAIVLLILGAPFSDRAKAQDCNLAKQRIYQITETAARHRPDSLQTLLDLAVFVRECERELSVELELWLLNNEAFALEGLQNYEEVAILVNHFFDAYFDEASDLYRARFYLRRLHLSARSNAILLPDILERIDWGRNEGYQNRPGFIEHVLQQTHTQLEQA